MECFICVLNVAPDQLSVEMSSWPLRRAVALEIEGFGFRRLILRLPEVIMLGFLTSGRLSIGVSLFQMTNADEFKMLFSVLFGCPLQLYNVW